MRKILAGVIAASAGVGIYAASFYAIVRLEGPGGGSGVPPWARHAEYPFGNALAHRLYGPMESFDQWLRPRAWQWWGFADECVPAYAYATSQEWPEELQPDVEELMSAIHDTWFGLDSEVDVAREALESGQGTQADLDAAIGRRKQRVGRALEAEKKFRARVAAVRPGN